MANPSESGIPFDAYQDPKEVIWKWIVFDAYERVIDQLPQTVLVDEQLTDLHLQFINAFNSNYNLDKFCSRASRLKHQAVARLQLLGNQGVAQNLEEIFTNTQNQARSLTGQMSELISTRQFRGEVSRVTDGEILICGDPLERFANQGDYFTALIRLFGGSQDVHREISESFYRGFVLSPEESVLVETASRERWNPTDLALTILLHLQTSHKFTSIQEWEFNPQASDEQNRQNKSLAMKEAVFLTGKVMQGIARFYSGHDIELDSSFETDPIEAFLKACGIENLTPDQITAVRTVALGHCSHGFNSGELTAKLAGSVRTTLPRAIMASLCVRSGIVHAGAIEQCMQQTQTFLDSGKESEVFLQELLSRDELLYGFGHRIHKIDASTGPEQQTGKDPRVDLYIAAARKGFPNSINKIDQLVKYAQAVRRIHPSLGANTDFGATVLFHALDIKPQLASGFFLVFRLPGICAQVIRELDIKANSRKPPFAPVIPYQG